MSTNSRLGESRPARWVTPIAAKLARWFFVFTVVAGVLSLANVGATVTVAAKVLFFVFAILALFFVAMFEPPDRHRSRRDVS